MRVHKGEGSTQGLFLVDEIQRLEETMKCNHKGDVLGDNFSSTAVTQKAELSSRNQLELGRVQTGDLPTGSDRDEIQMEHTVQVC